MSSRTCAKPGCNTSASATLTYDYTEPHGVGGAPQRRGAPDALRPLRRPRRRPHGPEGLGAAGPSACGTPPPSPPDFRGRPGPTYPAPVNEVATAPVPAPPKVQRWGLGDAWPSDGSSCTSPPASGGSRRGRATGHAGDDFDDLRSVIVALAQLGLAVGSSSSRGRSPSSRATASSPTSGSGPGGRTCGRAGPPGSSPSWCCSRCSTGRCSGARQERRTTSEGPAQDAHRSGQRPDGRGPARAHRRGDGGRSSRRSSSGA